MKKIRNLFIFYTFIIAFCLANSCTDSSDLIGNDPRQNPSPPSVDLEEELKKIEEAKSTPTPKPFPSFTPVPEPTLDLENFEFQLTITFNTRLPRVRIDDGVIQSLPLTLNIIGGKHKLEIFDIASGCYDGKEYIIDKDTEINLDADKVCNF